MATKPLNKPVLEYFEDLLAEVERVGGQSYLAGLAHIVDAEIGLCRGRIVAVERELKGWPPATPDLAANLRNALPIFKAELKAIEVFRARLRSQHGV